MLGRNAACPGGNAQPRGSFGGGSYRGKGGQITWQAEVLQTGGNRGGGGNTFNVKTLNLTVEYVQLEAYI